MKSLFLPTALLVGTVIGAGIFALPFVFQKSGLLAGFFYLVVLSLIVYIVHLMYADIIVRANQPHHRFPGYAGIYLGNTAEKFSTIVVLLATFLTLTAYLILSVSFFNLVTDKIPVFYKLLIFWAVATATIFLKIGKAALMEFFTTGVTLAIIFVVFAAGLFGILKGAPNLPFFNPDFAFLPFGSVLFSLLGLTAIQPLVVYFKEKNLPLEKIRRVILWGTLLPAIFYFLFAVGIIGLSKNVSSDAVSGLVGNVKPIFLLLLGVFGVVSLLDSYSTVAYDVKKNLHYEWKFSKPLATLAVIFLPPVFYFLGVQDFLKSTSIIGSVLFSIWGILTILIWRKAASQPSESSIIKKINPGVVYFSLAVFAAALLYEVFIR